MLKTSGRIYYTYICDQCKRTLKHSYGPITLSAGFGHEFLDDGDDRHFCSDMCLLEYVQAYVNEVGNFQAELL